MRFDDPLRKKNEFGSYCLENSHYIVPALTFYSRLDEQNCEYYEIHTIIPVVSNAMSGRSISLSSYEDMANLLREFHEDVEGTLTKYFGMDPDFKNKRLENPKTFFGVETGRFSSIVKNPSNAPKANLADMDF